jgi:hypothetical protein
VSARGRRDEGEQAESEAVLVRVRRTPARDRTLRAPDPVAAAHWALVACERGDRCGCELLSGVAAALHLYLVAGTEGHITVIPRRRARGPATQPPIFLQPTLVGSRAVHVESAFTAVRTRDLPISIGSSGIHRESYCYGLLGQHCGPPHVIFC